MLKALTKGLKSLNNNVLIRLLKSLVNPDRLVWDLKKLLLIYISYEMNFNFIKMLNHTKYAETKNH